MYLWVIAVVAAYFIKGLCGFANTLIFTTILSFGTANADISPIDLLVGYPSNLILTWKNRKRLDPKIYLPLIGLVLLGSIPGSFLLKNVDAGAIKLLFGVVVIVLGAEMVLREYSHKKGKILQNPVGGYWNPVRSALRFIWHWCFAGGLCQQGNRRHGLL